MFTLERLQQTLTGPLPGQAAQMEMAPAPVEQYPERWKTPQNYREAGVLLLLYQTTDYEPLPDWHMVLTKRPEYPGAHSGQISLPGGRRELDEPLPRTALRETEEEIGVTVSDQAIVGSLSPLYTPPSNFCIFPFVATISSRPDFDPDTREVAALLEVPINMFFDPAFRDEELWHFENSGSRRVPFFNILGHKVWGATAMILSEFVSLFAE
jgi:8-oxo-dGTP pyrophosphatase MutT (NUDIX family)